MTTWRVGSEASRQTDGRNMRTLRHVARLLRELVELARKNKAWWIVPLVITVLLTGILILAAQAGSPLVYTLF